MTNIKEQLEKLKKQQEQLKDKITSLEIDMSQEEAIYFSKWIGRSNNTLTIKGDKYVISYVDGDIFYSNIDNDYFTDEVSYKEGRLRDLEYGDIFIFKDDLNDVELYNFNIFVGKDKDGDYGVQYLSENEGLEVIKYSVSFKKEENKDILIFNRF